MGDKPLTYWQYLWRNTKWMWLAFAFFEALCVNALVQDDAPSFWAGTGIMIFLVIVVFVGYSITHKKYLKRL